MVAAPGRVSMMTGWPQLSVIFCPSTRARISVDPPGANGTMILIGFSGYLSAGDWAEAPAAASTAAVAPKATARTVRPRHAASCLPTFLSLGMRGPAMPRASSDVYHIPIEQTGLGGSAGAGYC